MGVVFGSFIMMFMDLGLFFGMLNSYLGVMNLVMVFVFFVLDIIIGIVMFSLNNGVMLQMIVFEFGGIGSFDGLIQFFGDFSQNFDCDGFSLGELVCFEIDNNGIMYGIFDNGLCCVLYEIFLGVVDNLNGLGKW